MYKVLIVDDEDIIKIGLKAIVEWKELGYEIIGTAGNGLEALKIIEELCPDLVITDIIMPRMNGIEMMEALRERGYKGKIIVLSNYGEIDYVKKAMKLGAEDYILKVSYSKEEFAGLLHKMTSVLEETESTMVERKIEDQPDTDKYFQVFFIILPAYVKKVEEGEYQKFSRKIKIVLEETLGNRNSLQISFYEKNKISVVFHTGDEKLMPDISIPFKIEKTLALYLMLKSSVIYGLNSRGREEMQKMLEQCKEQSAVVFYGEIVSEVSNIKFEKISDLFNFITSTNRYRNYIKNWDFEKMQDEIQSMVLNFQENTVEPYEVKDFIRQIIISIQQYFDESYQIEILKGYRKRVHECENVKELHELMNSSMEEINEYIMDVSLQKEDIEVTERIKKYIQEHIDSKLTLNDIAEMVGFNPNYLSGYFKQKTGQTLTYYINSQKMKYAKKMLENGQYRVKEVSERVGYEDAFYFSRCFKKYFGYSPKNIQG